jgi:hypothetical protein
MTCPSVVESGVAGPGLPIVGRTVRRVGWGAAAAAAATLGCAAGLAAGGQLPWKVPDWAPVLDDGIGKVTLLMAALGAAIGWTAGTFVGLALGPRRLRALLTRCGVGAVAGALAGGLGPVLAALTAGRLPAEAGAVLACGVSGALAGLVGVPRSRRAEPVGPSEDDWPATPAPARQRTPRRAGAGRAAAGSVVRLGPTVAVAAGCLAVVIVGPPSPAGWPMLGVGLLGLAVAWALSAQERQVRTLKRRVRALKRQLRDRAVEPANSH